MEKRYITEDETDRCMAAVLATQEVTPLTHSRRCQLAAEWCCDELGVIASPSFRRMVSKRVATAWSERIFSVKWEVETG